jgi:HEPN domain-containing protein
VTADDLARAYLEEARAILEEAERYGRTGRFHLAVRRSQEVVELALKGLLRRSGIEVPRVHDVSGVLRDKQSVLGEAVLLHLDRIVSISRRLRREREIAFYGDEETGLFGTALYTVADSDAAVADARWILGVCEPGPGRV